MQGLQIVLFFQQAQKYKGTGFRKSGLQTEGFCKDIFVAAVFQAGVPLYTCNDTTVNIQPHLRSDCKVSSSVLSIVTLCAY